MEILSAINDLIQDQEDVSGDHQPVQADARESTRLQQLIILPGDEGGIITRTDFLLSKFCAEEKQKTLSLASDAAVVRWQPAPPLFPGDGAGNN